MAPSFLDTAAQTMGLDKVPILDKKDDKIPMVLLVDTSGSMNDNKGIEGVNRGIQLYYDEISRDPKLSRMVEIALVSFSSNVDIIHPFSSIKEFHPTPLIANGVTSMGNGILTAIDLVNSRKAKYTAEGVNYYRPWIFMITDGAATDMELVDEAHPEKVELLNTVKVKIKEGKEQKHFELYMVGVADVVDVKMLNELKQEKKPLHLKQDAWDEMFTWIRNSQIMMSNSKISDKTPLSKPTWGDDEWTSTGGY